MSFLASTVIHNIIEITSTYNKSKRGRKKRIVGIRMLKQSDWEHGLTKKESAVLRRPCDFQDENDHTKLYDTTLLTVCTDAQSFPTRARREGQTERGKQGKRRKGTQESASDGEIRKRVRAMLEVTTSNPYFPDSLVVLQTSTTSPILINPLLFVSSLCL